MEMEIFRNGLRFNKLQKEDANRNFAYFDSFIFAISTFAPPSLLS